MLFTPENAHKVILGKKTMTRRLINRYEVYYCDKDTLPQFTPLAQMASGASNGKLAEPTLSSPDDAKRASDE